jgi:hypothetical protein
MIGVARQLGRFTVQRIARQADDAEQARQAFAGCAAATSRAPSPAGRRRSA